MVRFLNYQHFFDFKISTPILKNEKLKKLRIRHHKNNIFLSKRLFLSYACTSGHPHDLLRYIPLFL
jgi:hypothetical protein